MKKAFEQMMTFMEKNEQVIGELPTIPHNDVFLLREKLIEEEWVKLHDAMMVDDLAQIADGLADLCYVVIGTAASYGIYLPEIWEHIHANNMLKSGGKRDDGKVQKHEGHKPVDFQMLLDTQRPLDKLVMKQPPPPPPNELLKESDLESRDMPVEPKMCAKMGDVITVKGVQWKCIGTGVGSYASVGDDSNGEVVLSKRLCEQHNWKKPFQACTAACDLYGKDTCLLAGKVTVVDSETKIDTSHHRNDCDCDLYKEPKEPEMDTNVPMKTIGDDGNKTVEVDTQPMDNTRSFRGPSKGVRRNSGRNLSEKRKDF